MSLMTTKTNSSYGPGRDEATPPQERDEDSMSGHMPYPGTVPSTLDAAQNVGLYTEEGDDEDEMPMELNLADQVRQAEQARRRPPQEDLVANTETGGMGETGGMDETDEMDDLGESEDEMEDGELGDVGIMGEDEMGDDLADDEDLADTTL